jgi:hypothetical protein
MPSNPASRNKMRITPPAPRRRLCFQDLVRARIASGAGAALDFDDRVEGGTPYRVQRYRPRSEGLFARIERSGLRPALSRLRPAEVRVVRRAVPRGLRGLRPRMVRPAPTDELARACPERRSRRRAARVVRLEAQSAFARRVPGRRLRRHFRREPRVPSAASTFDHRRGRCSADRQGSDPWVSRACGVIHLDRPALRARGGFQFPRRNPRRSRGREGAGSPPQVRS